MKLYKVDKVAKTLFVYDKNGKLLDSKPLDEWENFTLEDQVGMICFHVSLGESVKDVTTGKDGYMTEADFYRALSYNAVCKKMFELARISRSHCLTERMVKTTDKDELTHLANVVKYTNQSIKDSIEIKADLDRKSLKPTFTPYASEKGLDALRRTNIVPKQGENT